MAFIVPVDDPAYGNWERLVNKKGAPGAPPVRPPGPAAPGSISFGGAPGYNPDYRALIESDPIYSQYLRDAGAQGISDASQRAAAIQRLLIQYGGDAQFADPYGDVTGSIRELASKNPYSIRARMSRTHEQTIAEQRAALAARGVLDSGEETFFTGRENTRYGEGQYDALNAFLEAIGSVHGSYTQAERQRAREIAAQMTAAAERQQTAHPAVPEKPATKATLIPGKKGPGGSPIYQDAAGNYYDQNGNPVAPALVSDVAGAGGGAAAIPGTAFKPQLARRPYSGTLRGLK